MSWYNKVAWSEGLFLRPQLFQQQERYLEHLAHKRAAPLGPFFWGFSHYALDSESLSLGKLVLASAAGVFSDGMHTSCDPHNWGLRMHQLAKKQSKGEPDKWEYPVAKAYIEAIKPTLMQVDWKNLAWPLDDDQGERLFKILQTSIETAMGKTAFGLSEGAMPKFIIPNDERAKKLGINPDDLGLKGQMRAKEWLLVVCKGGVVSIVAAAKRDEDVSALVRDLVGTLYHEARHAQQFFWVVALLLQFPDDYAHLPNIRRLWQNSIAEDKWLLAGKTPVPDEPSARVGLHRMLIGMYYWQLKAQAKFIKQAQARQMADPNYPQGPVFFADVIETELPLARKAAYDLLQNVGLGGMPIDVDRMADNDNGGEGYRMRSWEEDGFACDEIIKGLWSGNNGGVLPESGFCTKPFELASRGVQQRGDDRGEQGHAH